MQKINFKNFCDVAGCDVCKQINADAYWDSLVGKWRSCSGNGSRSMCGSGIVQRWFRKPNSKARFSVWLVVKDISGVERTFYSEMTKPLRDRLKAL